MNERDFYNESAEDDFFRKHLNEKGEFPRKRENWLKVAAILDQKQAKKRFWKWFWLVFLLASGNVWQAYCMFAHAHDIRPQPLTQVVRDTIVQFDTIYTYIYSPIPNAISTNNNSIILSKLNNSIYNSDKKSNCQIINQNDLTNQLIIARKSNLGREQEHAYLKQNSASIESTMPRQNHTLTNDYLDFNADSKINNYQKNSLNHLISNLSQKKLWTTLPLESKPLELLSISELYSESTSKTIENLEKPIIAIIHKSPIHIKPIGIGTQQGFSKFAPMPKNIGLAHWQGLYSDFTFAKDITFRLSMDYAKLNYKIFEYPLIKEPLRLPTAPVNIGHDYRLSYIDGQVSSWQTGIGVQYALPKMSNWQTFLTGGYLFRTVLPNKTEFEYKQEHSDDEKSINVSTIGLKYDHWWFVGATASIPIYNTWQFQMSAKYIYDNNHNNQPIHYGLMQAGFFYRFF